jgi:heme/copper-type cytochrome/quinol oxidase subunit 3
MPKERFLLWMLASIFTFQAGVFGFGTYYCARNGGIQACPELGDRYEQTFNVMIATTLALLTGSALKEK